MTSMKNFSEYSEKVFEECGHNFKKMFILVDKKMEEICEKHDIPRDGEYSKEQEDEWNKIIEEEFGKLLEG